MSVSGPNVRLRRARDERGWSQADLARELNASLGQETGADARLVRRWESGEGHPGPRWRRQLVEIFGKSLTELGVLDAGPEPETLDAMDPRARITRREMIRLVGVAGMGAAMLPGGSLLASDAIDGRGTLGRDLRLDETAWYQTAVDSLGHLYWSAPAPSLFESAAAHAKLGADLLRSITTGPGRNAIASAAARAALHAGRLAFFDLGAPATAQGCYEGALRLIAETDDPTLASAVYGHLAFIPGFAGDRQTADETLEVATTFARHGGGPFLRSWLHCIRAEMAARQGETTRADGQIRQAEDAINGTTGTDPDWLDWFDRGRLSGFLGYTQLRAGRHEAAISTFKDALDGLGPDRKQKAVVHFDLGCAYAPVAPDLAVEHVDRAAEALGVDWYAIAQDRIPALRAALAGTSHADEVEERVRMLV